MSLLFNCEDNSQTTWRFVSLRLVALGQFLTRTFRDEVTFRLCHVTKFCILLKHRVSLELACSHLSFSADGEQFTELGLTLGNRYHFLQEVHISLEPKFKCPY